MSRNSFEPRERVVTASDGTKIHFRPWDGDDYLHAFVRGDPDDPDKDKFCLNVYVSAPDQKESVYYAALSRCSASAWEQFVDKFLADVKYRKTLLIKGDGWDGAVEKPKSVVHPKCASAIARIEHTREQKLNFRIFADLKTFGQDAFSRKKSAELEEIVGGENVAVIKADERMSDERLYTSALKWCARGLSPNHAVRKVLTDKEISDNARSGYRR